MRRGPSPAPQPIGETTSRSSPAAKTSWVCPVRPGTIGRGGVPPGPPAGIPAGPGGGEEGRAARAHAGAFVLGRQLDRCREELDRLLPQIAPGMDGRAILGRFPGVGSVAADHGRRARMHTAGGRQGMATLRGAPAVGPGSPYPHHIYRLDPAALEGFRVDRLHETDPAEPSREVPRMELKRDGEGRLVLVPLAGDRPLIPMRYLEAPKKYAVPEELRDELRPMLEARERHRKERDAALERSTTRGRHGRRTHHGLEREDRDAWSDAVFGIAEQSRRIGERVAEEHVRAAYPGAVRLHPPEGPDPAAVQPSRSGELDQIWRVGDGEESRYVVVEAKGGSNGLESRRAGNVDVQQGTRRYFGLILAVMRRDPHAVALADALGTAVEAGHVAYLHVRAPIAQEPGTVASVEGYTVGVFDLSHGGSEREREDAP